MGVAVEAPGADTERPGRPRWRRAAVDALPSLASLLVCLALAMVGAALLAIVPRGPLGGVPVQVPAFFTGRDVRRIPDGSVALLAPFPSPRNASPMFWQAMADLRFRTPGGYFVGPDPSGKPHYGANPRRLSGVMAKVRSGWQAPRLGPALRAELAGDLACWRVSTVVGGVWVWWDVRPGELQGGRAAPDRGPGQPSPRR